MKRKRIVIRRSYQAPVSDVWDLWTTKDGIESWWGPEGFEVKVRKLDLRPGGDLRYSMTAVGADQVAFMKGAGLPLTTPARITYAEVVPRRRLVYTQLADFLPGVEPYNIHTAITLRQERGRVRMVLRFDAMHDREWTKRALMGRVSELRKLGRLLGRS